MDTLIGKFQLTDNQIANISTLNVSPFKGVSYKHNGGEVVAVSELEPTKDEIEALSVAISSLPEDIDKKVAQQRFNGDRAKRQFYETLGASIASLAPFWGVLSDMITFRNFEGIKAYADGLLSAGILKVEQYDAINEIFKSQNLDLDNL